jgi:hypothetical protein
MHKAVYQCNRFITSTQNTNQDSGSPDPPLAATVLFFSGKKILIWVDYWKASKKFLNQIENTLWREL